MALKSKAWSKAERQEAEKVTRREGKRECIPDRCPACKHAFCRGECAAEGSTSETCLTGRADEDMLFGVDRDPTEEE